MKGSTIGSILATVVAMTMAATSPAAAQQRGNIGLGVGINSSLITDVTNLLTPTVYVPIMASEDIMVEPSIGIFRESEDDASTTLLAVQAGILFMLNDSEDDRIYVGPRLGFLRTSVDFGDEDDSETDLTLAGVAGGEFFLREQFSLGGEVGLRYIDQEPSVLVTVAEFRVRWYF